MKRRNGLRLLRMVHSIRTLLLCSAVVCCKGESVVVADDIVDSRPFTPTSVAGQGVTWLDWTAKKDWHTIVDREPGQYLGHPTTALLDDGKTILCVYPKGHGKGPIVLKKSTDGGVSWSDRLPTPSNWSTSLETPTIFKMKSSTYEGLILFSGLYPIRAARSDKEGNGWTELYPIGNYGGIVAMSSVFPVKTGDGHYVALFHDDGRFFRKGGKSTGAMTLYQTKSTDAGNTWSEPEILYESSDIHLCEPGAIRSPDGKRIGVLLRENRRQKNSHWIISDDEGKSWSNPIPANDVLNGDRHVAKYLPDGRLLISFRDVPPKNKTSPFEGDWVAWVGHWEDLVHQTEGELRIRLKDNHHKWDCAYPAIELLPDGNLVMTTYGHWEPNESPYILSIRFMYDELKPPAEQ